MKDCAPIDLFDHIAGMDEEQRLLALDRFVREVNHWCWVVVREATQHLKEVA